MQRTLVYVDTKYRRFAHTYSGGPIKQRRPHVQSTHMNHHVKGDAGTFICLGERVLDFAVLQSSTWSNRLGNMPAIWPHAYFIALGPRLKRCKRSMLPPHCIMGLVLKGKPKKMLLPCAFLKFFFHPVCFIGVIRNTMPKRRIMWTRAGWGLGCVALSWVGEVIRKSALATPTFLLFPPYLFGELTRWGLEYHALPENFPFGPISRVSFFQRQSILRFYFLCP